MVNSVENMHRINQLVKQIIQTSPQATNFLGDRFQEPDAPLSFRGDFQQRPPMSASLSDVMSGDIRPSLISRIKNQRLKKNLSSEAKNFLGEILAHFGAYDTGKKMMRDSSMQKVDLGQYSQPPQQ